MQTPARIDSVDHDKFGKATVAVTLFSGMDESLYAEFKPGVAGQMAAAEDTLRTRWQDHDGMSGKIIAVENADGEPPFGSSGIQVKFQIPLVLEGFRPGRIARIRPNSWPSIKPSIEEQVRGYEDRWPSPDIFGSNFLKNLILEIGLKGRDMSARAKRSFSDWRPGKV